MFGISFFEFLIILLVAVLVIPAKNWPDVAKFLARIIKFIRNMIWKITDAGENIKQQIELENPINDLIKNTTDDVMSSFSSPLPKSKSVNKRGSAVKKPMAKSASKKIVKKKSAVKYVNKKTNAKK